MLYEGTDPPIPVLRLENVGVPVREKDGEEDVEYSGAEVSTGEVSLLVAVLDGISEVVEQEAP